jgi:LmbE family N-acetylglucosaminyl deacetylase
LPYRLLAVTAHPDDESGAFGGALLLAHRDGVETSILCLTDGQAAHYRGGVEDNAELGRQRRAEFAAACEVLGVAHCEVLDYPDGALAGEDFQALIGVIVQRIRAFRPHVVLTFGGDGSVNLHRDHTLVSAAATAAFHWAARPEFFPQQLQAGGGTYAPQKLYYTSTPFVTVRGHPDLSRASTVPWTLSLDLAGVAEKKWEAFGKHRSQAGVLERVKEVADPHRLTERYLLAAAPGQIAAADDKGLFDHLTFD